MGRRETIHRPNHLADGDILMLPSPQRQRIRLKKEFMDWQQIEDAITSGNLGRLRYFLIGSHNLWNDYYAMSRRSFSPPYLHMVAALSDRFVLDEAVRLLVNAGMDINMQDREGKTALHVLLERFTGQNKHSICHLVKTFLHYGCDPCKQDANGETTLHVLAKKPSNHDVSQVIDELFTCIDEDKRNIYVNTLDNRGKCAIYYALDHSAFDRMDQLLKKAVVSFIGRNPTGTASPLHVILGKITDANLTEVRRAVTLLLERGCDPRIRDERGQTALHVFAKYGRLSSSYYRIVKTIILHVPKSERTIFLNTQDERGDTALHAFVRKPRLYQKSRIVSLFLEHHVDPTIANMEGNVPLFSLGDPLSFDANASYTLLQSMIWRFSQ